MDKRILTPAAMEAAVAGDVENFTAVTTIGGIEAQEARGQTQFVASQSLPLRIEKVTVPELESLGFVFGEPIDEVFQECSLPDGWAKVAEGHSMWSRLVDADGNERASIFYKAAFYDRRATLYWNDTSTGK